MGTKRRRDRAQRKLVSLRLEIARAQARLASLRAAIDDAHSDASLAAVQGVRAENRLLLATNLRAEKAACASQLALDLAVKASQTDALTGLRNRSVLWDRLSHELDVARRLGHHVGVLLLDLDDFKLLNDRHGHAFGDRALQWVAQVLTTAVRASDTVCRLGGDEFVVVASTATRDDVGELARKITQALGEPLRIDAATVVISASVGVAVFPEDGDSEAALVMKADECMYRTKRARSGQAA